MHNGARTLKKLFFLALFLGMFGFAGYSMLKPMLEKNGDFDRLAYAIEVIKIRSVHPTMSNDQVAAEVAKANPDGTDLLRTLAAKPLIVKDAGKANAVPVASAPANGNTSASPADQEIYVRTAENREALLKAQLPEDANASTDKIRGLARDAAGSEKVIVSRTADGRDVYGVIRRTGTEDLNALDRINALNIPDHMKQKILRNYQATGFLPEIVVHEKRKPAAVAPAAGSEAIE